MDLGEAKSEFLNYVRNYDLYNKKIIGKMYHSLRVMEVSKELAKALNLTQEEVDLATLIGLLHDIGRFEQLKNYDTFSDLKSIDHADKGIEILKENNYIRKFVKEDNYDEIIYKAIKNHNKFEIEKGLTDKELLFSKIIRDADKLDILYEGTWLFWDDEESKKKLEESTISSITLEKTRNKELVERCSLETPFDNFIGHLCFIFDIQFNYSFKKIVKEDYINRTINLFDFSKNEETKKQINEIREILNKFLEEKVNGI